MLAAKERDEDGLLPARWDERSTGTLDDATTTRARREPAGGQASLREGVARISSRAVLYTHRRLSSQAGAAPVASMGEGRAGPGCLADEEPRSIQGGCTRAPLLSGEAERVPGVGEGIRQRRVAGERPPAVASPPVLCRPPSPV